MARRHAGQEALTDLGYECGHKDKKYKPIHTYIPDEAETPQAMSNHVEDYTPPEDEIKDPAADWKKRFDTFPKKESDAAKEPWVPARDTAKDCLQHLESVGVAFMPKTKSNCRRFGKEQEMADADNDGVAIFWKKEKFRVVTIDFLLFDDPKRNEGVVRVELELLSDFGEVSCDSTPLVTLILAIPPPPAPRRLPTSPARLASSPHLHNSSRLSEPS